MISFPDPSCNPFALSAADLAQVARRSGAVPLADVQPYRVPWLWPGRIPLDRVTLLASDPGMGKSLVALDIAARVSRGEPWPDLAARNEERGASDESGLDPRSSILAPASVLLLTAEDNLADTVRPRLEALGADCSRIIILSHVRSERDGEPPRQFAFHRDLTRLRELLYGLTDCRLVVIDPVTAFLGNASEHSSADMWNLLASLSRIAQDRRLAIVLVSHFRKKSGAAMFRTLGSLAFIAATRTAWTIVNDPAEPTRRLFLPLKNNLAPETKGLAFTIEASEPDRAPKIHWLPDEVDVAVDSVSNVRPPGRPDEEREFAIAWLTKRLANGPCPMIAVRNSAEANGIAFRTLRRAYRELGGKSIQRRTIIGRKWFWMLPGSEGQNPGEDFWPSGPLTSEHVAELFSP